MSNELKVHIYHSDQIDSQLAALARQLKQHETGTGFEVQVTRVTSVKSALLQAELDALSKNPG